MVVKNDGLMGFNQQNGGFNGITLWLCQQFSIENMAIEIVSFPMKNGGSFNSYANVYQRVTNSTVDVWKLRRLEFRSSLNSLVLENGDGSCEISLPTYASYFRYLERL